MEPYLDDCFKLGMYLGPKIDDGLAMNTKILKKTGQVIHRSMFWALTQDEQDRGECKDKQLFMKSLHQRLGPQAMVDGLADLGMEYIPEYNLYDDESQNVETFPSLNEEPEVTLEWGGGYLNVEILLPRQDKMA